MIAVLDASAAVELAVGRPRSQAVRSVLVEAELVLAPDLYVSEVANVFWKYVRARLLEQEDAVVALDSTIALVDEFVGGIDLYREALAFASQFEHPVYDAMYAVLARRNVAALITVDERLTKLARRAKLEVAKLKG